MKILYHGSPYNFKKFNFSKIGTESGTIGGGFGIYFSDTKADAFMYGDILYTCSVELKNQLSNKKITLPKHILKTILEKVKDVTGKSYFDLHPGEDEDALINQLITVSESDTNIVGKLIEVLLNGKAKDVEKILNVFIDYGYNYTIDNDTPDTKSTTHYVFYDLQTIKILNKQTLDEI